MNERFASVMYDNLFKQSAKWWRLKRPVGWTFRQHDQNPTINCNGEAEKGIARAVSAIYYSKRHNVLK
jgi:hypothetical protein